MHRYDEHLSNNLLPITNVPNSDEVEMYDPQQHGYCCTELDFRPDLNGTPSSPWNRSAARVFRISFLRAGEFECTHPATIEKAFTTHLKHVIRDFKKALLEPAVLIRMRRAANRAERKRRVRSCGLMIIRLLTYLKFQLFVRRLIVCAQTPRLRPHVPILQRLGVDGMSSDESDHDNGLPQFRVLTKAWRHPNLAPWLRVFDALHRQSRFRPIDQNTKGAQPHLRIASAKLDNRRAAVPQLPQSAYHPGWLADRTPHDLDLIEIDDQEEYDFTHSPDIQA